MNKLKTNKQNARAGHRWLQRFVRRFGITKLSECIGLNCDHGIPNDWPHVVGKIEDVTPTGRLAVRHWNRVHIVPWNRICDIYDECPYGKYGQHRKMPNGPKLSHAADDIRKPETRSDKRKAQSALAPARC